MHEGGVEHMVPISIHAVGGADRSLTVSENIPHQTGPWEELIPLITVKALATAILGIAWKYQARRSILENRALHALQVEIVVKMRIRPKFVPGGGIRFPA